MPTIDLSIPLVETAVRATMVLLGALGLAAVLRQAAAATRHALWTATTGALLALPLLQGVLPRIPIGWLPPVAAEPLPVADLTGITAAPDGDLVLFEGGAALTTPTPVVAQASAGVSLGTALTLVWVLGLIGFALPLALGHLRARRLVRGAASCHDGRLLVRFVAAAHAVQVRESVTLLLSDAVRTPMTGGMLRPVVLLPSAAIGWSDDCLDAVLRHELVHVRRRDALRQLGTRLSVALYWFHPLAWRAARHGALAREQAADEAVVGLGTRPSRYARHLLDLADPVAAPLAVPALVRLDHPHLEERVMAILRAAPVPASRRQTLLATLGIAAWTLGVAAVGPATAQVPLPPRPAAAPAPPLAPSALSAVAAPARPAAPSAPAALPVPAAPRAPAPPPKPEPGRFDCDFDGTGYRTGNTDRNVSTRMHTSTVDGIRICVAVRGRLSDDAGFIPTGRLPAGVVMTLAASGPEGTQRLVVTGTGSGNNHEWFVNDRERPFDAAAAEWRDAMMALAEASIEKSRIRGQEARLRGEVARATGDEARLRGQIARIRGEQAAAEARIAARSAGVIASRQAAEVRAASQARLAEVEARQADAAARIQERTQVTEVRMRARQEALEARLADEDLEPRERQRVERELEAAQEAMVRDQARLEQEVRRMEREVNQLREREARVAARVIEESSRRDTELREREVRARGNASAEARIRAIEERMAGAEVAGRVRQAEERIEELQADRRIAEIDARMAPLEARLRAAIRKL